MERIEAAAIRAGKCVMIVPKPGRHHHIFHELDRLNCPRFACVQGFVTSTGRFVEREEARKLAEAANQLIPSDDNEGVPIVRQHKDLFSEDVW